MHSTYSSKSGDSATDVEIDGRLMNRPVDALFSLQGSAETLTLPGYCPVVAKLTWIHKRGRRVLSCINQHCQITHHLKTIVVPEQLKHRRSAWPPLTNGGASGLTCISKIWWMMQSWKNVGAPEVSEHRRTKLARRPRRATRQHLHNFRSFWNDKMAKRNGRT